MKELALQDLKSTDFSKSNCLVVGVPNTGNDYALTYSETINIPYENYITTQKVNRTFI